MRMISKSQLYCTTMEFNAPLFTRKNQNCTTMEFSASLFTGKNQKMGLYAVYVCTQKKKESVVHWCVLIAHRCRSLVPTLMGLIRTRVSISGLQIKATQFPSFDWGADAGQIELIWSAEAMATWTWYFIKKMQSEIISIDLDWMTNSVQGCTITLMGLLVYLYTFT